MLSQSNVLPEKIYIGKTEIRLTRNVKQIENDFNGITEKLYEYEEVIVDIKNPRVITKKYIENNFLTMFEIAIQEEYQEKIKKIKEYYSSGILIDKDLQYYARSGIINNIEEIVL